MSWNPHISVFDERGAKKALKAHILAVQSDALMWANDGAKLPPFKDFNIHLSPRLVTDFPAITFLNTAHKAKFEDILEIDFAISIEVALQHGKQDWLSESAPKYSMALESILTNLPETTFNENSKIIATVEIEALETTFDVQGKTKKNQFIEVFQIEAQWKIEAAAYND